MNDTRTTSMLERVPVILAVTAGSYGLSLHATDTRRQAVRPQKRAHERPMAAHPRKERASH